MPSIMGSTRAVYKLHICQSCTLRVVNKNTNCKEMNSSLFMLSFSSRDSLRREDTGCPPVLNNDSNLGMKPLKSLACKTGGNSYTVKTEKTINICLFAARLSISVTQLCSFLLWYDSIFITRNYDLPSYFPVCGTRVYFKRLLWGVL